MPIEYSEDKQKRVEYGPAPKPFGEGWWYIIRYVAINKNIVGHHGDYRPYRDTRFGGEDVIKQTVEEFLRGDG